MTARGPGGRIAPDGRPPQPPGVGKNARRHDLERPATPGLHGTDLQQGDVQRLEAAQRVAPRRQQPPAAPARAGGKGTSNPHRRRTNPQSVGAPDPLEFAKQRIGGGAPTGGGQTYYVDPSPWVPLVEAMALHPNSGGAMFANYSNLLRQFVRRPTTSRSVFIDLEEATDSVSRALE
jgi:hypothetical protein